jgi:hypothetical protein
MPRTYTTITDLADYLAEGLDLDRTAVTEAIRDNHHTFSNYGHIPASELAALSAAVWTSVTGLEYPAEWMQEWRDHTQDEATQ